MEGNIWKGHRWVFQEEFLENNNYVAGYERFEMNSRSQNILSILKCHNYLKYLENTTCKEFIREPKLTDWGTA